MGRGIDRVAELKANAPGLGAGLLLLVLAILGVRWLASHREGPPPRKVMQFTVVHVQPQPPRPAPPPPTPPKALEQVQTTRVEMKPSDIPPPDAPRPPSDAPAAGRLALAAEGDGPGDAFNLAGNPGGRGLLSGGGLGDGTGLGEGGGAGSRYGWYYAKIAAEIEGALRRQKKMTSASMRVELRVWADESGRIRRVQLTRSTGDPDLDQAFQSVVGLRLGEPPPRGTPMPMIARVTARRLE